MNYRNIITVILALSIYSGAIAQQVLSLEQCKELAMERNHKIRIAAEQIGVTDALTRSAKTGFYPSISANATYIRTNKQINILENDMFIPIVPFSAINPETGEFNPNLDPANTFVFNPITGEMLTDRDGNPVFHNYAWLPQDQLQMGSKNLFLGGVSLMQPIYTGGKIREMYRISQYGSNIAQANKSKQISDIIFQTEESYWRVVSLQEKVKLVNKYVDLLEKLSSDLENLYNEGIIIRNDLLRVTVKSNEAQLNLLKAKNGLVLSRMALCQLTGLPLSSDLTLTDSLDADIFLYPDMAYADSALAFRPELEMLNQTLNIARSGVNLMKSRYLPSVGLTANYMLLNPNPYKGFSQEFGGDWNVGVAINIPIFHWNDKAHTLRAARHEQKVVELQISEAQELISLEVQQAIFKTTESAKKMIMAQDNLNLAKENLKVATESFTEGMVKTTDVLEAQALWQDAWSELIDARMDNQLSKLNLRKVMGSL